MVSLLRKPFGFAFIYVLLAFLIGNLVVNYTLNDYIGNGIIYGLLLVFTLVYIFLVVAHLSNHFRLWASIYIAILGLILKMVVFYMYNPLMFMGAIYSISTWISPFIQFIIAYVTITIGNWLASFALKTKGHI